MEEAEISACSASSTDNSTVRKTTRYDGLRVQLVALVASTGTLAANRLEGRVAVALQTTCSA